MRCQKQIKIEPGYQGKEILNMEPTQPRSHDPQLTDLIATAHSLADIAGPEILPYFRKTISIENKAPDGAFDPVTAADKNAEHMMRQALERLRPTHGIIGEEGVDVRPNAKLRWVLDPIDGTRSFIMGSPMWGTLIGLLNAHAPILGLIDQPFTQERFWSEETESCWRGPDGEVRKLETRRCKSLSDALITTTHPDHFATQEQAELFSKIASGARLSRYGGDCYAYGLLAAGCVDLIIETGLKPHDVVALIPVIERAGGCITTWSGETAISGGSIVAAGDPWLHETVLKKLDG